MSNHYEPEINESHTVGLRHWVFQANPARYRIHSSLAQETEEWWNLNQHADKVQLGDAVAVWVSGSEAGIYALGRVVEGPITRPDSVQGQSYWEDGREGLKSKPRVRVHYDRVLFDRPLLKVFLEADPELWDMQIIRAPRGTNFPVREAEWRALQSWVGSDREAM